MKDCEVFLTGIDLDCGNLGEKRCAIMANTDGSGNVDRLTETLGGYPDDALQAILEAHKDGEWSERCVASPVIVDAVTRILSGRERNGH